MPASLKSSLMSRRNLLKSTTALAFGSLAARIPGAAAQTATQSTDPLDPTLIRRFAMELPNPLSPTFPGVRPQAPQSVTMSINETRQTLGVLKNGHTLSTPVWGYGVVGANSANPTRVYFPGPTFEVDKGVPLKVTFRNDLLGVANPMPVDTTLDWANPGSVGGLVPVPTVAHLHGAQSQYLSDGLPDAWNTPNDLRTGRLFNKPYRYENAQEAAHLWYHDHTRGITRTNVYMGLAGHYFIRDENEKALQASHVLPRYPYEVPVVLQDRQLDSLGNLLYPASDPANPFLPRPTHLPEFFGDIILANGITWPRMNVEQRKYRFRLLNGSDSRFYALRVQREQSVSGSPSRPRGQPLKILVIGNELGLLNSPVESYWFSPPDPTVVPTAAPNTPGGGISQADTLLIAPGERFDVIVDFTDVPVGSRLLMWNFAASPYNGQVADNVDYTDPTAGLSDRVIAFDVIRRDPRVPNATVALGTPLRRTSATPPLTMPQRAGAKVRKILLVEGTDTFGRLQTMLGTVGPNPVTQGTFNFADPPTERPVVGQPEIWEFHNTTADAHPIHMHLVDFRVLDRQPFSGRLLPKTNTDGSNGNTLSRVVLSNPIIPVEAWQAGKKDTVVAYPGYVTRVLVNFTRAGEYVYHCHILSHEDHEMMRPYIVGVTVASN